MSRMRFWSRAAVSIYVVFVAACGQIPANPMSQSYDPAAAVAGGNSGPRLFVISLENGSLYGPVAMFGYPSGTPIGNVSPEPEASLDSLAGCADRAGNVYVLQPSTIVEYSHEGVQIRKLAIPGYGAPTACEVDPVHGDLAVTYLIDDYGDGMELLIYPDGINKPRTIQSGDYYDIYSATYDDTGTLFLDGRQPVWNQEYYGEVLHGAKTIRNLTLNKSISFYGLQFDGRDIAAQASATKLYRIHGTDVVGTTVIQGSMQSFQIFGNQLLSWQYRKNDRSIVVDAYAYPAGGKPIRSVKLDGQKFYLPEAVVVSK
jgi:hypothetical protein